MLESEIVYFDPDTAKEVMGNRLTDTKLQQRTAKYLGGDLPDGAYAPGTDQVNSVRAEYLWRPTAGDMDYLRQASAAGFEAWTVSYQKDRYIKANAKKGNMAGQPTIELPRGQRMRLRLFDVLPITSPIGELATRFNVDDIPVTLTEFWAALRMFVLNNAGLANLVDKTSDISDWYARQAKANGWKEGYGDEKKAKFYYPKLMGLYAARAVLYCNYDSYVMFSYFQAEPAFAAATEALGVAPIIVRWAPNRSYSAAEKWKGAERQMPENTVDLSLIEGLNTSNIDAWVEDRVREWRQYNEPAT